MALLGSAALAAALLSAVIHPARAAAASVITKGDLAVSVYALDEVDEYTPSGTFVQKLMTSADGLGLPAGSAFDGNGNLYVTDFTNNQILRRDALTGAVSVFASNSSLGNGHVFDAPESVVFNKGYTRLYVSDANRSGPGGGINIVDAPTGAGVGFYSLPSSVGSEGTGEADWLAFDASSNLYMTNENPSQGVMKVDPTTGDIVQPSFVSGLPTYGYALSFDKNGNLWVGDTNSILEYDATGAPVQTITNPSFSTIFAAVFNAAGDQFYAGDLDSGSVFTYDLSGNLVGSFSAGGGVSGLSVSGAFVPPNVPGATVTPPSGLPGQVFVANWQCGSGTGVVSVKATDGMPLQDISQHLILSQGNGSYSQAFQVGPDGAYEFELLCNGVTTDVPFEVVAKPYVAMGDSFSSGEGGSSYDPATDILSTNTCHRGTNDTWTIHVAGHVGLPRDFAACSGDVVPDIVQYSDAYIGPVPPTAYPNPTPPNDLPAGWPEIPQLDHVSRAGVTQLVTMSIGGNDVGFPSILTSCIYAVLGSWANHTGGFGCAQRDQKLLGAALTRLTTGWKAGCYTLPGVDADTNKTPQICSTKDVPSLHALYEQIGRRLPPGGKVEVVGYPRLFGQQTQFSFHSPTHKACKVGSADGVNSAVIGSNDVAWLNAQASSLNSTVSSEVTKAQADLAAASINVTVKFIDVDHVLDSQNQNKSPFYTHRICDTGTPDFHALEFDGHLPFPKPQQWSFHPNDDGQRAYASAVIPKL